MTAPRVFLEDIVATLRTEGLLDDEAIESASQRIASMSEVQPWYIRAMVGFGAWLASLLLIGFVAGFAFDSAVALAVVGLALIAAAVFLRHRSSNDFVVQSALAASLAGQALLAFGIAESAEDRFLEFIETMFGTALIVSIVLFVMFPDRLHRVISVVIATASLTVLTYSQELNALVPLLGPALAGGLVLVHEQRAHLVAGSRAQLVHPLMIGLMLSSFGCLLLSTVYVLPELGAEFEFYPRPWISTILLGALLVYSGRGLWAELLTGAPGHAAYVVYALIAVVIAAAWAAPGLLLALLVVMLGAVAGNRAMTGAGIGFLAVFMAAYFYGIQITMLTKSVTLVGAGVAILLARWLMLKVLATPAQTEQSHA